MTDGKTGAPRPDVLPLGAPARLYARAALAAAETAETTWVEHQGRRVAAVVPCDVAMRGDWRKAPHGPEAGMVAPELASPVQPVPDPPPDLREVRIPGQIGEPLQPPDAADLLRAGDALLEGGDGDVREFVQEVLAGEQPWAGPGHDVAGDIREAMRAACADARFPLRAEMSLAHGMQVYDQAGRVLGDGDIMTIDQPGISCMGEDMEPGSRWRMVLLPGGFRLERLDGDD